MSLELWNRLPLGENAIQVGGTAIDSPIRELANGQKGVRDFIDQYLGEKDRIIRDELLSEQGTAAKILELGKSTVKKLQSLGVKHSNRARNDLARLEKDLKIVDDDDDTPDIVKKHLWERMDAMDASARHRFGEQAFNDSNKTVIRAILDYAAFSPGAFPTNSVETWKHDYAMGRDPDKAREFATLESDIEKLRVDVEQGITHVAKDSGFAEESLADRMNSANDLIRESELRRTESTADQISGANVRSPHEPNKAVTV